MSTKPETPNHEKPLGTTEAKVVGKIFERAAVIASVNQAFDDYDKFKAEHPDASIDGVAFVMVSGSDKLKRNEVQVSMGGDRALLLNMFLKHITANPD